MTSLKIVLATDGSIESDIATAALQRLPLPRGVQCLVTVVAPGPPMVAARAKLPIGSLADDISDTWRIQHDLAEKTASHVAEKLASRALAAEKHLLLGHVAEELLDSIVREQASLVVAGSGAHGNLAAFFLGSVSRKLVLYSEASILLGRKYADERRDDSCLHLMDKPKLDVVVAVDGSPGSELSLLSLENLQTPVFRNVYVLAVEALSYGPTPATAAFTPPKHMSYRKADEVAECAAQRLAFVADRVEPLTSVGRPSARICELANDKGADLILMGANRHGALERFLVGSCAYETATSAPCSLLILRDVLPLSG